MSLGGFVYLHTNQPTLENIVGIYEIAAFVVVFGTIFTGIGMWLGVKMADQEWKDLIDLMRTNPNITKQDLIFRLDQRK